MQNKAVSMLFSSATSWFINDLDQLCIRQHGASTDYVVSEELLSAEHPLLPGALRLLIEKHYLKLQGADDTARAEPRCAWYTRTLLHTPFIKIIDGNGKAHKVSSVTSINTMETEVGIVGSVLTTAVAYVHDQKVYLVKSVKPTVLRLPKELMATQFPGWAERCRIGQALDLTLSELSAYVLSNNPAAPEPQLITAVSFE